MRYVEWSEVCERFAGKRVAVVGSAPSVLDNEPGFIDSHDIVVRVNNYKLSPKAGKRCDVHYSFYGRSIRKTADELRRDGVTLCLCKCPSSMPIRSDWHMKNRRYYGVDFRYIYRQRLPFWFCDTFVPDDERFLYKFHLLDRHIPTTGFAAILDVIFAGPASIYLTGFDFFSSGKHNVDEAWKPGDQNDPIGHVPEKEGRWIFASAEKYNLSLDSKLMQLRSTMKAGAA